MQGNDRMQGHMAVLEVGCAELPAGQIPSTLKQMKEESEDGLTKSGLEYDILHAWATPRRLIVLIEGLSSQGRSTKESVRGPAASIAFGEDGKPTKAAEGFSRGQGVSVDELVIREEDKGRYVYAVKQIPGRAAQEILAEQFQTLLGKLRFRRTMRWGTGQHEFLRPVHWVLALFDDEVLSVDFAGQKADRVTYGPRFCPRIITIERAGSFVDCLESHDVIVDPNRRRERIQKLGTDVAAQTNGKPVFYDDVLDEVVHLVEYPEVLAGRIPDPFLSVPRLVIETAMMAHLRFFPVETPEGELAPTFLSVINGTAKMKASVRPGNELVLNARLADAVFFWREDRKRSLAEHASDLGDVVFHESLGSLADKIERLQGLVDYLHDQALIDQEAARILRRAAALSKADLVTLMVAEFPTLQGRIGEEYARADGEDEAVCRAVGEHYLPVGRRSDLPRTCAGRWLSLLDKIDDLAGAFSASLSASGSEDPYGLRRSSNGVLRLLSSFEGASLSALLSQAVSGYPLDEGRRETVVKELMAYMRERLGRLLIRSGYPVELTHGVLAVDFDEVRDVWRRAEIVARFLESPLADDIVTIWRRCHNLGQKGDPHYPLRPDDFEHPEAQRLCADFLERKERGDGYLNEGAYAEFLKEMSKLRPSVDAFLDSAKVMVDDAPTRKRRLSLLNQIARYVATPMDWGALPG